MADKRTARTYRGFSRKAEEIVSSTRALLPSYSFKLVDSLADALRVRTIRNSCRTFLTNNNDHIGRLQQVRWYYQSYRKKCEGGEYRLYLFRAKDGQAVAYGALARGDAGLLITECVFKKYRRQGYGAAVLKELIRLGTKESQPLLAEVWSTNEASVALHERAGFKLLSSSRRQDRELLNFIFHSEQNRANSR